jgi:eight-cysteine-cluster-containing protein
MVRRFGLVVLAATLAQGCERAGKEHRPEVPAGAGQVGPGLDEPGDGARADGGEPGETPQRPVPSAGGERVAIVPESHPLHGRLEAPDMPNACERDGDCHVGGCGGEVCSAEPDVITTCEVLPVRFPEGSACGCVERQCRWWHPEGAELVDMGASTQRPEPRSGEAPADVLASCSGEHCRPGQECVSYYGIAGTKGPELHSCEWRCRPGAPNDGCPPGTRCQSLIDGPGRVCR